MSYFIGETPKARKHGLNYFKVTRESPTTWRAEELFFCARGDELASGAIRQAFDLYTRWSAEYPQATVKVSCYLPTKGFERIGDMLCFCGRRFSEHDYASCVKPGTLVNSRHGRI